MLRYAFILLIAITAVTASSCKKTKPCKAIITVVDSLGDPVAGAKVILRQDSVVNAQTGVRADLYQEQFSAGTGEAFFEFEWEAVLNVEISKDALTAKDYIRLEQSEEIRKTVVLK
jgi:hypothetical protein